MNPNLGRSWEFRCNEGIVCAINHIGDSKPIRSQLVAATTSAPVVAAAARAAKAALGPPDASHPLSCRDNIHVENQDQHTTA